MAAFNPGRLASDVLSLNHNRPPCRATRRAVFYHQLRRSNRPVYTNVITQPKPTETPAQNSGSNGVTVAWLNAQSTRRNSTAVYDVLTDQLIDVFVITETCHRGADDVCLRTATPRAYLVADVTREKGTGGGFAVFYRSQCKCATVDITPAATFESLCLMFSTTGGSFVLLTIYRPGSLKTTSAFFDELTAVLEVLAGQRFPFIIDGDLNIHLHDTSNPDTVQLTDLLASFGMTQHVSGPTHRLGGTLDVIITNDHYVPTMSRHRVRPVLSHADYRHNCVSANKKT